jgi:hypothetical protein
MACNRWALGDWAVKLPRPVGDAYVAHPANGDGSVVVMQQSAEEFRLKGVIPLIGRAEE